MTVGIVTLCYPSVDVRRGKFVLRRRTVGTHARFDAVENKITVHAGRIKQFSPYGRNDSLW